jgi:hypothetical protein
MMIHFFVVILFFTACETINRKKENKFVSHSFFKRLELERIALVGINVIPMHKDGVIRNQTVLIENGVVKKILNQHEPLDKSYREIDGKGKYLIPGLIDSHVHISLLGQAYDSYLETDLFLANGVTSVRNMAGSPFILNITKPINNGKRIGPDIITTGPIYNGASVYSGVNKADWCFRDDKPEKCALMTPEFAKHRVKTDKSLGYDAIKSREFLSRKVYMSLYRESKRSKIPMVGHFPSALDYKDFFSNNYQKSIEHVYHLGKFIVKADRPMRELFKSDMSYDSLGLYYYFRDIKKEQAFLYAFSKSDVRFVPTLHLKNSFKKNVRDGGYSTAQRVSYFNRCKLKKLSKGNSYYKNLQKWSNFQGQNFLELGHEAIKRFVYMAWKSGVKIVAGSDTNAGIVISGFSIHDELKALSSTGIPNQEVLKTATVNAAKLLGLDKVGYIKSGTVANLVILDENPLDNIEATKKIRGFFIRGRYFDKKSIDNTLLQIKKSYEKIKCKESETLVTDLAM